MSPTATGILAIAAASFVFAVQDGISLHLAGRYNVLMVVMIRYWFFAAFVIAVAARRAGGLRAAARTQRPWVQVSRGVLLATEIWVAVWGFTLIGLTASHAVFATYPLWIAALAGPLLGERPGPRRWLAIAAGFLGVLVVLRPGSGVFQPAALVPLVSALMFALYGVLTRIAGRVDGTAASFFWTGTVGAVVATAGGVWFWEPMTPADSAWMAALCLTGATGHWLLIRGYEAAEASVLQPFTYLQLVFAVSIGVLVFGEALPANVAIGAGMIVASGVATILFERRAAIRRREAARAVRRP